MSFAMPRNKQQHLFSLVANNDHLQVTSPVSDDRTIWIFCKPSDGSLPLLAFATTCVRSLMLGDKKTPHHPSMHGAKYGTTPLAPCARHGIRCRGQWGHSQGLRALKQLPPLGGEKASVHTPLAPEPATLRWQAWHAIWNTCSKKSHAACQFYHWHMQKFKIIGLAFLCGCSNTSLYWNCG